MIFVDGEAVNGLDESQTTIFGDTAVTGIAEVVYRHHELDQARFYADKPIIPIIGEEYMVRSFTPSTIPTLFDHVRAIGPVGLITFGVGTKEAARRKVNGTHMDIVLREWAKEGFLGVVIEGVYYKKRYDALDNLKQKVGGRVISMSRSGEDINILSEE